MGTQSERLGFQINIFFIYLFLLLINLTWSRIVEEVRFSCSQSGNFSITQDCGIFISCIHGEIQIGQCPYGQNFDANQHSCATQKDVDCSKHIASYPSRFMTNRLKRSPSESFMLSRIPVQITSHVHRRRRRKATFKSPTRPWGKWSNGTYVPYLFATSKIDSQCIPQKEAHGIGAGIKNGRWVGGSWVEYDEIPQKPEEGQAEEVVEPEDDVQGNEVALFAPTDAPHQKSTVDEKKRVLFRSDNVGDDDKGVKNAAS